MKTFKFCKNSINFKTEINANFCFLYIKTTTKGKQKTLHPPCLLMLELQMSDLIFDTTLSQLQSR